jgi:uncharacterized protein YfbU (UPF0304 family)
VEKAGQASSWLPTNERKTVEKAGQAIRGFLPTNETRWTKQVRRFVASCQQTKNSGLCRSGDSWLPANERITVEKAGQAFRGFLPTNKAQWKKQVRRFVNHDQRR